MHSQVFLKNLELLFMTRSCSSDSSIDFFHRKIEWTGKILMHAANLFSIIVLAIFFASAKFEQVDSTMICGIDTIKPNILNLTQRAGDPTHFRGGMRAKYYMSALHITSYMPRGYATSQTCVYFMNYHFIWCSKYRRPVLARKVKERLEVLIREKVGQLGCRVMTLTIGKDHIHLFVQANPKLSPNTIIGQVKAYTSRILRREFSELRSRLPTLWTRSYFVSTHGHVSNEAIQKYIEEQKGI